MSRRLPIPIHTSRTGNTRPRLSAHSHTFDSLAIVTATEPGAYFLPSASSTEPRIAQILDVAGLDVGCSEGSERRQDPHVEHGLGLLVILDGVVDLRRRRNARTGRAA
jgi:hypothetical protein